MAHNGGIEQLNLSFPLFGADFPFLDLIKNCQQWDRLDNTTAWDLSKHDDDGWMTEIYGTGYHAVTAAPTQAQRPGNYVATWQDGGTAHIGMANTPVSGSVSGANGRYEFLPGTDRFVIGASALGTPYMKNLKIFHADDEAAVTSGQVWGGKFLSRMTEGRPYALRFLNPLNLNRSPIAHWSDRKPLSYYSYDAPYMKKSLYAGVTTNDGDDYSIDFPGFTLTDKARVIVKWNATATGGTIRVNVAGTGLIRLMDEYLNDDGGDTIDFAPRRPTVGKVCALFYDEMLNAYIMGNGSQNLGNGGVCLGWPIELCIDLCNTVGAHCQIPMPRYACDPMSDFCDELCDYARDNLDSGLKLQIELPNELFNGSIDFNNNFFARTKEETRDGAGSNDVIHWAGRVLPQIGKIMDAAYSGDRSRYDCIGSVQTNNGNPSAYDPMMNSTRYLSEPGQVAGDAAKFWTTRVDITGYWNSSQYNKAVETTAAANYAAASTDAERAAIVDTFMRDDSGTGAFTLPLLFVKYAAWKTWLDGFGQDIVIGQYEGGYSPDYGQNEEINTFRAATKLWPGLYAKEIINCRTFIEMGGIAPSAFDFSGGGAFEIFNNIWDADPPRWTAFIHFNNNIRRYTFYQSEL